MYKDSGLKITIRYETNTHYGRGIRLGIRFELTGMGEIVQLSISIASGTITHFNQKVVPAIDPLYANPLIGLFAQQRKFAEAIIVPRSYKTTMNLSFIPIEIIIHNTGLAPIEEYKISLDFEGDIQDLSDTNEKYEGINYKLLINYIPNTYL